MRADQRRNLSVGYLVGRRAGRLDAERELAKQIEALRCEVHAEAERVTATLIDQVNSLRSELRRTRQEVDRLRMLEFAAHSKRDLSAPLN
jgi:hypothetical protein